MLLLRNSPSRRAAQLEHTSIRYRILLEMNFVVVDVETANQEPSSICQVALAFFCSSKLVEIWESLINPRSVFLPTNVRIHGIRQKEVCTAPVWPEVRPIVLALLSGKVVASHTYFDRMALTSADLKDGLEPTEGQAWVDTCAIARAASPYLSNHKLPHVARFLGIRYLPHDAKEDARCAGEVLLRAATVLRLSMVELLDAHSTILSPGRGSGAIL